MCEQRLSGAVAMMNLSEVKKMLAEHDHRNATPSLNCDTVAISGLALLLRTELVALMVGKRTKNGVHSPHFSQLHAQGAASHTTRPRVTVRGGCRPNDSKNRTDMHATSSLQEKPTPAILHTSSPYRPDTHTAGSCPRRQVVGAQLGVDALRLSTVAPTSTIPAQVLEHYSDQCHQGVRLELTEHGRFVHIQFSSTITKPVFVTSRGGRKHTEGRPFVGRGGCGGAQ